METVRQLEFLLAEVRREAQRIHERRSQEYLEGLEAFVNELLRQPLRWYWRHDLAEYLVMAELDGYRLRADSTRVLEGWIEEWAKHLGHLPADPTQPETIDETISDGGSTRGFPPARSSPEGDGPSSPLTVPPIDRPTVPVKPAPPAQALPKNWPKLTPEEIDRTEINAGRRWWYPLVPVGETDWVWLSKLEVSAQKAREALTALYQDLAALGRMVKEFGDSQSENIEPLLAKQADIQRHYDRYIECLIAIEITWRDYLRRVIVVIGVYVIALKEKIDRSLPLRVEGFHSNFDGQFKTVLSESREALQLARGRVERGYTILVWTDRAVMAAQFVLPLLAAGKVAFAAAVKQGFSEVAAFRIAVKTVLVGAVKAAVVGGVMSEVVPPVLAGLGIDEAEVRAGMTILLSLSTFAGAVRGMPKSRSSMPNYPAPAKDSAKVITRPARRLKARELSPGDARRKAGIAFNKSRESAYPYKEVPVAKPGGGKPYSLDSYDPEKGEIVFRRDTQFSEIQLKTAKAYFREFVQKYPPGSLIPNVPSAKDLAGQRLEGKMIFEVSPQWKAIPPAVLREAARLEIWIRDTNGKVYHAN